MSNDKKPYIIDAKTNAKNLDMVGGTLLNYARRGKSIDAQTAMMIALLLAECRNYSTMRDAETLDDETSKMMLDHLTTSGTAANQREEVSASEAADEIVNDLRKSGINL